MTRLTRLFYKDPVCPIKCYVDPQLVSKNDICDCKYWCKYPPDGRNSKLAYIKVSKFSKLSKQIQQRY